MQNILSIDFATISINNLLKTPKSGEKLTPLWLSVIALWTAGKTYQKISEMLNFHPQIYQKYSETDLVGNKTGRSWKRKMSVQLDRVIQREVKIDHRKSAKSIAESVEIGSGIKLCLRMIKNRLNKSGMRGRVSRKTPFISATNRRARLEFVNKHTNKDKTFWNNIL